MADSAVAVTAGSGTNIDTRTEVTNGNHRQVVVIGDPSTNAGVAPVDVTNGLSVNITNASLTVASHAITLAAGATSIGKAEDFGSSDADVGVAAMAVRKASPANTSGSDGDYEFLQISAGRLWASATIDAALPAGSNSIGAVTNTPLTNFGAGEYETVAAGQTAQALGATGATGDYISGILVIPATTSPGVVTLLDNAISIPVFVGGASSVSNLVPFFIPLGMISVSGAWKITTGTNVSCIGIGNFS